MREQYESGSTQRFNWNSDGVPDSPPRLKITGPGNIVILDEVSSGVPLNNKSYYVLVEMPTGADGVYVFEYSATQTLGGVTKPFVYRREFNVATTRRSEP